METEFLPRKGTMDGWVRTEAIGSVATPLGMPVDYLRFSGFSEPGIDGVGVGGIEKPNGLCQDPKADRQIVG
jgi:hypothetical protein